MSSYLIVKIKINYRLTSFSCISPPGVISSNDDENDESDDTDRT